MKTLNKLWIALTFLSLSLFVSCTTEITLTLKADDSVDIQFEGGAGAAFTKMILSASGTETPGIDTQAVSYELAKAGFENVKAKAQNSNVSISMSDKKHSSYIFTSGLVKFSDDKKHESLKTQITRKSLEAFYNSADEQTRMILDLFLSPVFNNDYMSEEEYLEMLASFYGEPAAKEVQDSFVKIILIGKNGKKEEQNLPLVQLLCGSF
ncbi:MAG: hypothetical protein K6A15_02200 [Treponema sp.]|nr:hypothetical protein [Treponema sp.]